MNREQIKSIITRLLVQAAAIVIFVPAALYLHMLLARRGHLHPIEHLAPIYDRPHLDPWRDTPTTERVMRYKDQAIMQMQDSIATLNRRLNESK